MKRQLVEKDVELRQQRQTILTLYDLMGSPDKPDKKRKPGKYGSATYHDPYVSTEDILKKMIHKTSENYSQNKIYEQEIHDINAQKSKDSEKLLIELKSSSKAEINSLEAKLIE